MPLNVYKQKTCKKKKTRMWKYVEEKLIMTKESGNTSTAKRMKISRKREWEKCEKYNKERK